MTTLFDPARHEPLCDEPWDEARAREWIVRIADDAHACFDVERLWPSHPLDREGAPPDEPFMMLYIGAGGVIWALDALARAGLAPMRRDYAPLMGPLRERNRRQIEPWGWGTESLLMGQCGLALLDYRFSPDAERADRIAQCIARNADHRSNELLWGAPGTLHAALAMHETTGDRRWPDAFVAGASALHASFDHDTGAGCRLWTQDLYGDRVRYLGAAHGFAGNAGVIVRGLSLLDDASQRSWTDELVETAVRTAVHDGPHVNWPPLHDHSQRSSKMLVQWCHGAPGMIACLAGLSDARLDGLLAAAGELVFRAGPLAKGGGLCHGTGGNGFAFLKLYRRSGDVRWLDRARAFAMHAIAQCERDAARDGQRRHSLWTGDPGVALYVAACLDGDDRMPQLDPEPRAATAHARTR